MLLERDELAGWLQSFDQYKGGKGGDTAHWLTLYNAKALRIDRKTGAQEADLRAHRIGGHRRRDSAGNVATCLGREHFENGLAARLLLAYPPKQPRRWSEATVSEAVEAELARIFDGLLFLDFGLDDDRRPRPIDLPLTPRPAKRGSTSTTATAGSKRSYRATRRRCGQIGRHGPPVGLIVQLVSDPKAWRWTR